MVYEINITFAGSPIPIFNPARVKADNIGEVFDEILPTIYPLYTDFDYEPKKFHKCDGGTDRRVVYSDGSLDYIISKCGPITSIISVVKAAVRRWFS